MGFISRLLGAGSSGDDVGICLDHPSWELAGATGIPELISAISGYLPPDAVLYFEGSYHDDEIHGFLAEHAIPAVERVALGTVWPRPEVFHLPPSPEVLAKLESLMEQRASLELAVHFHIYGSSRMLLQWHDAPYDPILLGDWIDERQVAELAETLNTSYRPTA